jgi:hypothetical protein
MPAQGTGMPVPGATTSAPIFDPRRNDPLLRYGKLTSYVPVEALGYVAIFTAILAVYIPHTIPGAPEYARLSLLIVAVSNIVKALKRWVTLPDGGLESSLNVYLGPPSPLRTVAVGLRRKEGQELFWYSAVLIFIAYYAPHLTLLMLKVQLFRVVVAEVTNVMLVPFHYDGKSVLKNTPEEHGLVVDVCMVSIPLLYAYFRSDVA